MNQDDIVLEPVELERITGHTQPRRQLSALHAAGFWRARLVRGVAVLERAHYNAVCAGALPPSERSGDTRPKPQLRAVK